MRCSQARRLMPDYADHRLPEAVSEEVRSHLVRCTACSAEEADLRSTLQLLSAWSAPEPRLGYDALLSRIEQRGQPRSVRAVPRFGVPAWTTAVLAAISIAGGALLGVSSHDSSLQKPTEQQVVVALDLGSFDDVVEASMLSGVAEESAVQAEGGSR